MRKHSMLFFFCAVIIVAIFQTTFMSLPQCASTWISTYFTSHLIIYNIVICLTYIITHCLYYCLSDASLLVALTCLSSACVTLHCLSLLWYDPVFHGISSCNSVSILVGKIHSLGRSLPIYEGPDLLAGWCLDTVRGIQVHRKETHWCRWGSW